MAKKPLNKPVKKTNINAKFAPQSSTKPEQITIMEKLKNQVFPHIVEDFAHALKALKNGQSIRFGKLGVFKKSQRQINGYTGYSYSFKAHSLLKK